MCDALEFDRDAETDKAEKLIVDFNVGQGEAFEEIDGAVASEAGGFYFLTGPGGTGKTRVTKVYTILSVFTDKMFPCAHPHCYCHYHRPLSMRREVEDKL